MSKRLGMVKQGTPYEVRVRADRGNQGSTFVFIRWWPEEGQAPRSFLMRLSPGQEGVHKQACPPVAEHSVIDVVIDVPDQGKAQLEASGPTSGKVDVFVQQDTRCWMEVVP